MEGLRRNKQPQTGGFGFEQIDVTPNQNNLAYDFNIESEGFYRLPYFNTESGNWENVPIRDFTKNVKSANSSLKLGNLTGNFNVPDSHNSVTLLNNCNLDSITFKDSHFNFSQEIEVKNGSQNNIFIYILNESTNQNVKEFYLERSTFIADSNVSPTNCTIKKIGSSYYLEQNKMYDKNFFQDEFTNYPFNAFLTQTDEQTSDDFLRMMFWNKEESRMMSFRMLDFINAIRLNVLKGKGTLIAQNDTFNPFDFDTIIIPRNYAHADLIVDVEILDIGPELNTKILKFIVVKETPISLKIRRSGVLEVVTELQNDFSPELKQLQMIFYANGLKNLF